MQLKRIFITLLVAIVVLSMAGLAVSAAGTGTFDIAVESNSTADVESLNPGDTVEIKVVIENNPGAGFVEIDMVYDPAVLVPNVDIVNGDTYNFSAMVANKGDMKMLLVSAADATNATKTGTAFTVSFQITEAFEGDASVVITATAATTKLVGVESNTDAEPIVYDISVSTCHFDYANPVTEEPDCLNGGRKYVKCTDEGCTEIKVLEEYEPLGHDEVAVEAVAPDCTNPGSTAGVNCSRCDYTTVEEVKALGHDEVAAEAVAPTCTEVGYTAGVYCTRCDYTTVTEVKALGHTEVKIDAIPASCYNNGHTEGSYCSVCKVILVMPEVVTKLEHVKGELKAVDATCTKPGLTAGEICTLCNTVLKAQEVVVKDHTYTSAVTAPTCTAAGYTTYTCTCGATYKDDIKDPVAHTYTSAVTAPTCTAVGYTTYTCTCGATYKDDIKAPVDHTYTTAVTAPTCTTMGYTTYTCACGDTYKADYVEAKGHTAEIVPGVAPTYGDKGITEGEKCSVCDTVLFEGKEIPAKSSAWIWLTVILVIVVVGVAVAVVVFIKKEMLTFKKK